MLSYQIEDVQDAPVLSGASGCHVQSARIVRKQCAGLVEQIAFMVGSLIGLPVVPGFADSEDTWHSVFIPGMVEWRERFNDEVSEWSQRIIYGTNQALLAPWIAKPENARMMARVRAFDEFLGNCDRHEGNLGLVGDSLVVFDHDHIFQGFSVYGVHEACKQHIPAKVLRGERERIVELMSESVIASLAGDQDWVRAKLERGRNRLVEYLDG
jgi:hypothetical protein